MHEVWRVAPDLACVGKSIANGLPLTVLAGRREFMDGLSAVRYGMTHESEAVSVAAAVATIREVLEHDACGALARKGAWLIEAFTQAAAEHGVAAGLRGHNARPILQCHHQGGLRAEAMLWLLIQELARDGVLTLGAFNLCYSHTDEDLDRIAISFRRSAGVLAVAVEAGSIDGMLDETVRNVLGV
jgi:glutamate-1-semialdehyde 2,1-aminomutase